MRHSIRCKCPRISKFPAPNPARLRPLEYSIRAALGYEVAHIDLFRTRFATATQEQLREEVVILEWKGPRA